MAVFYCHGCDEYIDNDWNPGQEIAGEFVCESCYSDIIADMEQDGVEMTRRLKVIAGVCFVGVMAILASMQSVSQEVVYCRHGQTGKIITIQKGYACPFGYYRI